MTETSTGYFNDEDGDRCVHTLRGPIVSLGPPLGSAYFSWLENGLTRADSVNSLLAVGHSNPRLDLVTDNAARRGFIPGGMISIGKPNFQNDERPLCLGVEGSNFGRVFDRCIQRARGRRGKVGEPVVMCIERFPSFEALWGSLHADPPPTRPEIG